MLDASNSLPFAGIRQVLHIEWCDDAWRELLSVDRNFRCIVHAKFVVDEHFSFGLACCIHEINGVGMIQSETEVVIERHPIKSRLGILLCLASVAFLFFLEEPTTLAAGVRIGGYGGRLFSTQYWSKRRCNFKERASSFSSPALCSLLVLSTSNHIMDVFIITNFSRTILTL